VVLWEQLRVWGELSSAGSGDGGNSVRDARARRTAWVRAAAREGTHDCSTGRLPQARSLRCACAAGGYDQS